MTLRLGCCITVCCAMGGALGAAQNPHYGFDLTFGGKGDGKGKFQVMSDITFDTKDALYVLDGLRIEHRTNMLGNALVQVFNTEGAFQREFSVMDPTLGLSNMPTQVAVDKSGNVFISQPVAGEVWKYTAAGERVKRIALPKAYAISSCLRAGKDWILAVAEQGRYRDGVAEGGTEEMVFIDAPSGEIASRVRLSVPVATCQHVAVDSKGNVFMLVRDTGEIFKFSPGGERLMTLGAGRMSREEDGSVLLHTVIVDSKDNVYSMTHGNPGRITVFDPEFKTVRQRRGCFDWADYWSTHSGFTPLALDSTDRLWAGADGNLSPNHHPRPAIVRTVPGFLTVGGPGEKVTEASTHSLGLKASLTTALPYDIAYEPGKPIALDFVVAPFNRRVKHVQVGWQVFDGLKNRVDGGQFNLPLVDGQEARQRLTFTPPKFGWYCALCEVSYDKTPLLHVARNIGVTPRFSNMIELKEGESPGGWNDAPRQSFVGLPLMRLATGRNADAHNALEKNLALAEQYPDVRVFGIFTDKEDCTAENIRAVLQRFKGRVKYWEIINEPNLGHVGSVEKYLEYLKLAAGIIREIDPGAKVLGPDTCGIDLGWNKRFLELGGSKLVDVYTVHDYEGHESIDPVHWRWKYGELRKLMKENGIGDMPVWQTERAISGDRGNAFMPWIQAIRIMLHRDLLETLGIPNECNSHYYLNDGGFGGCTSFIWSKNGPYLAALSLRMRQAQVLGKRYAGELDFGPTGDKVFMGLRFTGADEDVYIVRNLGYADQAQAFSLKGARTVTVMDWAGNVVKAPLSRGAVTLTLTQMPTYIRVPKGGTLEPRKMDFGKNIASAATFTFNGDASVKNLDSLTNGIIEVIHAGHPHGGTDNPPFFRQTVTNFPQTIEITFPNPQAVSKMLIFGGRPDNAFCGLLDFDVQYFNASSKKWVTAKEVRTRHPESAFGDGPYTCVYAWHEDTQGYVVVFDKTVKASQFRLVILRTTRGLLADDAVALKGFGRPFDAGINLREIEIY